MCVKHLVNCKLVNTHSMKTFVPLHFEHKNDVTIIVKLLYRVTSDRQAICSKCNRTLVFME